MIRQKLEFVKVMNEAKEDFFSSSVTLSSGKNTERGDAATQLKFNVTSPETTRMNPEEAMSHSTKALL
jgi:hypothetical protein